MNEYDKEWNDQKYEFLQLSLALLGLNVEKYDNDWMNEWMNESILQKKSKYISKYINK